MGWGWERAQEGEKGGDVVGDAGEVGGEDLSICGDGGGAGWRLRLGKACDCVLMGKAAGLGGRGEGRGPGGCTLFSRAERRWERERDDAPYE